MSHGGVNGEEDVRLIGRDFATNWREESARRLNIWNSERPSSADSVLLDRASETMKSCGYFAGEIAFYVKEGLPIFNTVEPGLMEGFVAWIFGLGGAFTGFFVWLLWVVFKVVAFTPTRT
jgi:hypothetical protein